MGFLTMSDVKPGTVLAISSHVVRGAVGNRAGVFALETLGHTVWSLPTVVMPWHPGHGPSTRMVFPDDVFAKVIDDLIASPKLGEVQAVLTGYFGSPEQPAAVARLVSALRARNPDLLYVCDPVMGDAGGLYVPEKTAIAIRDHLLPLASVATPNRFELGWLVGREFASNAHIVEAALLLAPPKMLVTSAFSMMNEGTGNLLVSARGALLAEHRAVGNPPNGLGDLLGALFTSRLLSGLETRWRFRSLRQVFSNSSCARRNRVGMNWRSPAMPPASCGPWRWCRFDGCSAPCKSVRSDLLRCNDCSQRTACLAGARDIMQ